MQESFLYFSLAFSLSNVVIGLIMALYFYCTWRQSMLDNIETCVPMAVEDRKSLNIVMHELCRVQGNFVDSLCPEVFLALVEEIQARHPYCDVIEFERSSVSAVQLMGTAADWKRYFSRFKWGTMIILAQDPHAPAALTGSRPKFICLGLELDKLDEHEVERIDGIANMIASFGVCEKIFKTVEEFNEFQRNHV